MYGWRGRIGLVVPGNNTVIEPDFYEHIPEGVSVHTAQMDIEGGSKEGFEGQEAEIERCTEVLTEGNPDVIVYGVTAGSLIEGVGYETQIEEMIEDIAGVPAVATAASVKRAFEAVGAQSLSVSTPYTDELNEREAEFLQGSGYEVAQIRGLELDSVTEIGTQTPDTAYREARAVDTQEADALFISCTNYRTFDIIPTLEADTGKPVITSNQATLWDALRTIGITSELPGLGQLGSSS